MMTALKIKDYFNTKTLAVYDVKRPQDVPKHVIAVKNDTSEHKRYNALRHMKILATLKPGEEQQSFMGSGGAKLLKLVSDNRWLADELAKEFDLNVDTLKDAVHQARAAQQAPRTHDR